MDVTTVFMGFLAKLLRDRQRPQKTAAEPTTDEARYGWPVIRLAS